MDANGRPSPLSRWLTAGFTVAFAVSVAAVLFAREIGGGLSVEPRVAAGLSLAAYGGLALRGLRRAPLGDRLGWWAVIVVAHGTLGLLAGWLFGFIRSLGFGAALAQAFGGFAPALLVALVAAPAAALPFRPRVDAWRRPRVIRDPAGATAGSATAPAGSEGSAGVPKPAASSAPSTEDTLTRRDAPTLEPAAVGSETTTAGRRARLHPEAIERALAGLARTGRFALHARDVDGRDHVVSLVRDVAPETIETTARRLVARVPPASVLTVVTDRVAVSIVGGPGVVVAGGAGHPRVPAALVELLVTRAAAALGIDVRGGRDGAAGAAEPEVAVLRPEAGDPGSPGTLAVAVQAAFDGLDLGRLVSLSVRTADHRTELRWTDGAGERSAVVAASGLGARAGLARRQAARAAARLEAPDA